MYPFGIPTSFKLYLTLLKNTMRSFSVRIEMKIFHVEICCLRVHYILNYWCEDAVSGRVT